MDLSDSERLDATVEEQVKALLDHLRADLTQRGVDPAQASVTVWERDRIFEKTLVATFTLYPANIGEMVFSGTIKPGDFVECFKAITTLSGFSSPLIDAAPIDISGDAFNRMTAPDIDLRDLQDRVECRICPEGASPRTRVHANRVGIPHSLQ